MGIVNYPTQIQKAIEMQVTNGLGYRPMAEYLSQNLQMLKLGRFEGTLLDFAVDEEKIRDSEHGLQTNLAQMDAITKVPRLKQALSYLENLRGGSILDKIKRWIMKKRCSYSIPIYENRPLEELRSSVYSQSLRNISKFSLEGKGNRISEALEALASSRDMGSN